MKTAGFTLLEVLVALVVLGFILVGLTQGTQYGLRAIGVQARNAAAENDLDAVDRVLQRLIGAADPGTPRDPPPLVGTSGTVSFVSVLPNLVGARTDAQARMALGVQGGNLVLRFTPLPKGQAFGPPAPPASVELLHGVQRIALSYWMPGANPHWVEAWDGRLLPALVRLRVTFPPGDARHWPDFVMAPRRTGLAPLG